MNDAAIEEFQFEKNDYLQEEDLNSLRVVIKYLTILYYAKTLASRPEIIYTSFNRILDYNLNGTNALNLRSRIYNIYKLCNSSIPSENITIYYKYHYDKFRYGK